MNKDLVGRLIAILLWVTAVILWGVKGWWYIGAVLFIIHFVEIFAVGVKTGRGSGKPFFFSIVMTMVFGVTWWGPLRRKDK